MYLSSYRLGDQPEHLTHLLPAGSKVAVLGHAIDDSTDEHRAAGVQQEIDDLAGLGLSAVDVDLRTQDAALLGEFDGVWVRGGNTFELRHVLAVSGADRLLVSLVRAEELVYAGYSAGGCVLAPSLRDIVECDEPAVVLRHGVEPRYDGLGLLDRTFVPHVDTPGHPESEVLTALAQRLTAEGVPHLVLRDGQAWVVDGDAGRMV